MFRSFFLKVWRVILFLIASFALYIAFKIIRGGMDILREGEDAAGGIIFIIAGAAVLISGIFFLFQALKQARRRK